MGTIPKSDDDVGLQYKKAFKGLQGLRDRVPYDLKNVVVGKKQRIQPFEEKPLFNEPKILIKAAQEPLG